MKYAFGILLVLYFMLALYGAIRKYQDIDYKRGAADIAQAVYQSGYAAGVSHGNYNAGYMACQADQVDQGVDSSNPCPKGDCWIIDNEVHYKGAHSTLGEGR